MAEQAKVTEIQALEDFRANLIVFLSRAHQSADEVGDEIRRLRGWLQQEQRHFWERELRRRQRLLDAAQQELLSAKLSNLRDNLKGQQEAVRKAKALVAEAEEKLRNVKIWSRDFAHAIDPLIRRIESLRQFLDFDLPKGIAFLVQAQHALSAYADVQPKRPIAGAAPAE